MCDIGVTVSTDDRKRIGKTIDALTVLMDELDRRELSCERLAAKVASSNAVDAWGRVVRGECGADGVKRLRSAGVDGRLKNCDDILHPPLPLWRR